MIVIPMAGISRRFREAGYSLPKYMLQAHGRSLFAHAVGSFATLFGQEEFLFIARDVDGTADFIATECQALGIARSRVVILPGPTAGQAETVSLGLNLAGVAGDASLTIFNIDTFRPGFAHPPWPAPGVDGYLEVFRGSGANWSYARLAPGSSDHVAETAEKRAISDLCCTGLYYFRTRAAFDAAFTDMRRRGAASFGTAEYYVAPLFNYLIAQGADIRISLIARDAVIFCGVPEEYDAFLRDPPPGFAQPAL